MNSTDISRLPYRRGVGAMVLNREGNVFVAQRLDMRSEAWQMPQGGIDEGELPWDAIRRELNEEIGTANFAVLGESQDWLRYDLPADLIPKLWNGQFRGQEQKWYLLRFLGDDSEIDIATEKPEFSTWRWANPAHLPDLIVPFKRPLYRQLLEEFRSLIAAADQ